MKRILIFFFVVISLQSFGQNPYFIGSKYVYWNGTNLTQDSIHDGTFDTLASRPWVRWYVGNNGGSGTSTINGATDVDTAGIADGDMLSWDSAAGKWNVGSFVSSQWATGSGGFIFYNSGNVGIKKVADDGHALSVNGTFSIGGSDGSTWYTDADGTFTEVIAPIGMTKPVWTFRNGSPQWIEDSTGGGGGGTTVPWDSVTSKPNSGAFVYLQAAQPVTAQTGGLRVTGNIVAQTQFKVGDNWTAGNAYDFEMNRAGVSENAIIVNSNTSGASGMRITTQAQTTYGGIFYRGASMSNDGVFKAGYFNIPSVNTGVTIGPYTAHPLIFYTTNTQRAQISATGEIFLGGTSAATSTVQIGGSFARKYSATATSVTLDATYDIVEVTATGQTITLPTAVGITGRMYTIKLTASGSGTVATTSSQTIDGSTTYSLSAQFKYLTVQSNGANWIIVANN